jgi:putative ABC transport system substrate-binding protein
MSQSSITGIEGHAERRPALAANLVRRQVSVIVADVTLFAQVAKAATPTIPIVYMGGDPIEFGLVASVNRPGGNVTGVSVLGPDLTAKRLELLHKLVPGSGPIATLSRINSPGSRPGSCSPPHGRREST